MQEVATSYSISQDSRWPHCVPPSLPGLNSLPNTESRQQYQTESSVCQIVLQIADSLAPALPSHDLGGGELVSVNLAAQIKPLKFFHKPSSTHTSTTDSNTLRAAIVGSSQWCNIIKSTQFPKIISTAATLVPSILQCYFSNSIMHTASSLLVCLSPHETRVD